MRAVVEPPDLPLMRRVRDADDPVAPAALYDLISAWAEGALEDEPADESAPCESASLAECANVVRPELRPHAARSS